MCEANEPCYLALLREEADTADKQCGAKTRSGLACRKLKLNGKKRCRLHGGLSTGPKTDAGKRNSRNALENYRRRRSSGKHSPHLS